MAQLRDVCKQLSENFLIKIILFFFLRKLVAKIGFGLKIGEIFRENMANFCFLNFAKNT